MAERGAPRIALLSLEPWDRVWRRNQHLAAELVGQGIVAGLQFCTPPRGGLALRARVERPIDGIDVVTPPLLVPRRHGGHAVLGAWLRRRLRGVDVLWVNDPVAARGLLRAGLPTLYDVTDDWRSMPQPEAERQRTVAAEDRLAATATTVVCSPVLAQRWRERYGIEATVIANGVDAERRRNVRSLPGAAPHAVYVGTLHANRLDLALVADLAASTAGTVHLVGPDHLEPDDRARLVAAGVRLHGAVPHEDVPGWLVAADVLICPHVVDEFTLSLDAIKAHEYLATDRAIVATASSGFQCAQADGLTVTGRAGFVAAVRAAAGASHPGRPVPPSWADRAREFADVLARVLDDSRRSSRVRT